MANNAIQESKARREALMAASKSGNTAAVNQISQQNQAIKSSPSLPSVNKQMGSPALQAPKISPIVQPSQVLQQTKPLPSLNTSSAQPSSNPSAPKPTISPTATPQQTAQAKVATGRGLSPREAFSSDAAYQTYLKRAGGNGAQLGAEPNPEAAPLWGKRIPEPTPTTPQPAPVTSPETVKSEADQILADSKQSLDELNTLKDAQVAGEGGDEDAIINAANNRYNAEQANADRMEALQQKVLNDRNTALNSSSEVQRKDAKLADEQVKQELQLQRERTQQAYNDQIVEQKVQNTKRTLQKESMLAALGGYGSLTKNNELQDLTVENDRLMNGLVFNKDQSDKEISFKLTNEINTYQQNLRKIEVDKNSAVSENYDKYLEYIDKIQGDREMSEVNKQKAITDAAAAYKKNVAKINQDTFEKRYDISQTAANQARQIKNQERDDARATMKDILNTYALSDAELTPEQKQQLQALEKAAGYPVGISLQNLTNLKAAAKAANLDIRQVENDAGDVSFVAIDKTTGEIKSQTTLDGLGKGASTKYQVHFNPVTGEQTIFDPSTGRVVSGNGKAFSTYGNKVANGQIIDDAVINNDTFKKCFQIGQKVNLQCGEYASTISTAQRVGNSWQEKQRAIDKRDNPKPGDKLLVPLGVRTGTNPYGHVAVVTNYDPATELISVVESNKVPAGGETVSAGTYDLNELKKRYGTDFGFASGDFKPGILAQLEKGSMPLSQNIDFSDSQKQNNQQNKSFDQYVQEAQAQGMPLKQAYEYAQDRIKENIKPPTEAQAAAATYAKRMQQAEDIFDNLAQKYDFTKQGYGFQRVLPNSPLVNALTGGYGKSNELKQQEQAERNFINAVLRRESGSAINPSEFESAAQQYFPMPGDTPEVLSQKSQNRKTAIEGLKLGAKGNIPDNPLASVSNGGNFDQSDIDIYNQL
jgi:CHAP domain